MTVKIHGTGTIEGVVAGGLPDGSIVDADIAAIAANKLTGTIADARFPATLPAVSGTNLTNLPPSGKVLYVDGNTSGTYFTSTSTSWVTTNTKINVTPSSTSSRILILYTSPLCYKDNAVNSYDYFTIYRGSHNLNGNGFQVAYNHSISFNNFGFNAAITHLDAPATTSQITYEVFMRTNNSGQQFAYRLDGTPGMVVMEIG
jgi:hypothetical protein